MAHVFVVSGPSGAGKTTLVNALLQEVPLLQRVITYTSRMKRVGEIDGRDYFFISRDEFQKRIQTGFFSEWATVYGHYYGSALRPSTITDEVNHIIILDPCGARAIKNLISDSILIWIHNESIDVLHARLHKRAVETVDEISERIKDVWFGMSEKEVYAMYDYHITAHNEKNMIIKAKKIICAHVINPNRIIQNKMNNALSEK